MLLEAFEPGLVLELFETYRGNAMVAVPTMLVAMMEHPSFASTDLSSVKAICSGGSTVPAALVTLFEQKLGAPFTIVFGQTECSPVATMTMTTDTIEDKAGTIGLPLPNIEVKIVNPDTGKTCAIGEIGEFCTRGYHVMLGYFEMPDATAAAIDAEGWLHTGDLCAMDARGYCTVEGPAEGHDHPRRREHLSARAGGIAVPPSQGRRGRGRRPAARKMGRRGRAPSSARRPAR